MKIIVTELKFRGRNISYSLLWIFRSQKCYVDAIVHNRLHHHYLITVEADTGILKGKLVFNIFGVFL